MTTVSPSLRGPALPDRFGVSLASNKPQQIRVLGHNIASSVPPRELLAKILICMAVVAIPAVVVFGVDRNQELFELLERHPLGSFVVVLGQVFLAINWLALLWRTVLFLKYRPAGPCADEQLPRVSVVVPAYNEGEQVLITLRSLAASDYPAGRMEIIAVDDGSVDDTWHWISLGAKELAGLVTPVRLPSNQGKRRALHAGFRKSSGDILVTVDSDSTVEPDTLRRLVSPLVHDKRVGAVAGNVRVLNRKEGIIPRMVDVIFLCSFDFLRASQSEVNTVMCTPGALSAYRRTIVVRVLQEWLAQKFCGRPATIGEDRAMTNLILREGYHVLFQQDALVYTKVPTEYANLCKMFLRWARSNVRETLVMSTFAFRRFRTTPMTGARVNLVLQWMFLTKAQAFMLVTLVCFCLHPTAMSLNILFGIVLGCSPAVGLYAWRRRSSDALWGYLYGIFWFAALSWITPYALLTPYRSSWLTRQIKLAPGGPRPVRAQQRRSPAKLQPGRMADSAARARRAA
jgi:hyaluronan synthase